MHADQFLYVFYVLKYVNGHAVQIVNVVEIKLEGSI